MSEGNVALVTGASRGIGRAVVEELVASGRSVLAVARDEALLLELAARHPGRVHALPFDLAQPSAVERVVDAALALVGHVDELVYAAGIVRYANVGEIREADLRAQLEVNFVAPFLLAQRLGEHMRARGQGAMVLVASTLGLRPAPATAAYAASKAALIHAARSLALELAPHVRVNAIAPGVVDTDMVRVPRGAQPSDPVARAEALDTQMRALAALHPLGRLGTPQEVARAISFLLDASWITGSTLRIDGGLLAG